MDKISFVLILFLDMLKSGNPVIWIALIVILGLGSYLLYRSFKGKGEPVRKPVQAPLEPPSEEHFVPEGYYWCEICGKAHSPNSVIGKKHFPSNESLATPPTTPSILGTGVFNCLCLRKINGSVIADFRDGEYGLPYQIGEQYQFDPSCPFSGMGSIVMEKDGQIVDYDPREVEYKSEESPEYAHMATHWKGVVNDFWKTPVKWWQSASTWMAGAMIALVFFVSLMLMG